MQYITNAVTILTVIGSLANAMKKRWCFYVWTCTNLFWSIYNLIIREYGQSFIYFVNFGICVFALFRWKNERENKNHIKKKGE